MNTTSYTKVTKRSEDNRVRRKLLPAQHSNPRQLVIGRGHEKHRWPKAIFLAHARSGRTILLAILCGASGSGQMKRRKDSSDSVHGIRNDQLMISSGREKESGQDEDNLEPRKVSAARVRASDHQRCA